MSDPNEFNLEHASKIYDAVDIEVDLGQTYDCDSIDPVDFICCDTSTSDTLMKGTV